MSLPFTALHRDLQELFYRCFIDGVKSPEKRPSALEWVSALKIAEENLICCFVNPCHYYQKSSHECIWCERAALMKGLDCFPDPRFVDLPEQEALLPISADSGSFPPGLLPFSSVASQTKPASLNLPVKPHPASVQKAPQNTNVQIILRTGTVKVFDGIEFVYIEPGEFDMGSSESEAGRRDNEGPLHRVKISSGFWLGKYPVTQGQWKKVMGNNPSFFQTIGFFKSLFSGGSDYDNYPVEQVSWYDVQEFIKKLNKNSATCKRELDSEQVWRENAGGCYRLPTEAEWEYACRAGTSTPFWIGNAISTVQANYNGNYPYGCVSQGVYRRKTTLVNEFPANHWGLYDMHGNVWEWVLDKFDGYYYGKCVSVCTEQANLTVGLARVYRSGSWNSYAGHLRSALRGWYEPGFRNSNMGFRLVLAVRR